MLVPVFITRSILVVGERKTTEKVSTCFIATFADGSQKSLVDTTWQVKGLTPSCVIGLGNEAGMSKDACTLYFCDWSNVPARGTFRDNYPKPLSYLN